MYTATARFQKFGQRLILTHTTTCTVAACPSLLPRHAAGRCAASIRAPHRLFHKHRRQLAAPVGCRIGADWPSGAQGGRRVGPCGGNGHRQLRRPVLTVPEVGAYFVWVLISPRARVRELVVLVQV